MPRKPTLHEIIGHPITQSAIQQLAGGMDPRLVAAQLAGNMLSQQMAKQLGAPAASVKPGKRVTIVSDDNIIDAEFTPIPNSAPKRRGKR